MIEEEFSNSTHWWKSLTPGKQCFYIASYAAASGINPNANTKAWDNFIETAFKNQESYELSKMINEIERS